PHFPPLEAAIPNAHLPPIPAITAHVKAGSKSAFAGQSGLHRQGASRSVWESLGKSLQKNPIKTTTHWNYKTAALPTELIRPKQLCATPLRHSTPNVQPSVRAIRGVRPTGSNARGSVNVR